MLSEAVMNNNKTKSLSWQREIENRDLLLETEIDRSISELNMKTMLRQSGIIKQRGYEAGLILYLVLLLPFLKQCIRYLVRKFEAEKDAYYRFLNQERFNWRKFVYLLALRVIAQNKDIPLSQKVLIADDTITPKTGKKIELASYHYDHTTKRTILGN
jgi:hypothetical protein